MQMENILLQSQIKLSINWVDSLRIQAEINAKTYNNKHYKLSNSQTDPPPVEIHA